MYTCELCEVFDIRNSLRERFTKHEVRSDTPVDCYSISNQKHENKSHYVNQYLRWLIEDSNSVEGYQEHIV